MAHRPAETVQYDPDSQPVSPATPALPAPGTSVTPAADRPAELWSALSTVCRNTDGIDGLPFGIGALGGGGPRFPISAVWLSNTRMTTGFLRVDLREILDFINGVQIWSRESVG